MSKNNATELKGYVKVITAIGYAVADLIGLACGIVVASMLCVNAWIVVLAMLGTAGVVAGLGLLIVWAISLPYTKDTCELNMALHIVMSFVAAPLWIPLWIGHTTDCLNEEQGEEIYNPTAQMLLCMFVPFYSIYWYFKQAKRLDEVSGGKSNMAVLCLVFAIILPIVSSILMQNKINALDCTCKARA